MYDKEIQTTKNSIKNKQLKSPKKNVIKSTETLKV